MQRPKPKAARNRNIRMSCRKDEVRKEKRLTPNIVYRRHSLREPKAHQTSKPQPKRPRTWTAAQSPKPGPAEPGTYKDFRMHRSERKLQHPANTKPSKTKRNAEESKERWAWIKEREGPMNTQRQKVQSTTLAMKGRKTKSPIPNATRKSKPLRRKMASDYSYRLTKNKATRKKKPEGHWGWPASCSLQHSGDQPVPEKSHRSGDTTSTMGSQGRRRIFPYRSSLRDDHPQEKRGHGETRDRASGWSRRHKQKVASNHHRLSALQTLTRPSR